MGQYQPDGQCCPPRLPGLTAVPEPETCAAVAGLALVAFAAWRQRRV